MLGRISITQLKKAISQFKKRQFQHFNNSMTAVEIKSILTEHVDILQKYLIACRHAPQT